MDNFQKFPVVLFLFFILVGCGTDDNGPPPPPDINMLGSWTITARFPTGSIETFPIEITSQSDGNLQGSSRGYYPKGEYHVEGSLWWGLNDEPVVWMTIFLEPELECHGIFGAIYYVYTRAYEMQAAPISGGVISNPDKSGEVWSYCRIITDVEITATRS